MIIESNYNIGDKILLQSGQVATIKGVHLYIGTKKIGYHLHIGGGVFVSPSQIVMRLVEEK